MDVKLLALYPLVLNALRGQPGVSLRRRRERIWTQVECGVESKPDGRCYAQPSVPVGSEAGHPTYRLRIDLERGPGVAGLAIDLRRQFGTSDGDGCFCGQRKVGDNIELCGSQGKYWGGKLSARVNLPNIPK